MDMIEIGDKVKVLFKVYEDTGWAHGMDDYIGDGNIHLVTNDYGTGSQGLHRVRLNYGYAFPVICLELVAKGQAPIQPRPIAMPRGFRAPPVSSGIAVPVNYNRTQNWVNVSMTVSSDGSGDNTALRNSDTSIWSNQVRYDPF